LSELGLQIDLNAKLLTRSGKYLEVDVYDWENSLW
jgi:hypothetical protein